MSNCERAPVKLKECLGLAEEELENSAMAYSLGVNCEKQQEPPGIMREP